jgi:HlyD family secretion protein
MKHIHLSAIVVIMLWSCASKKDEADASGTFEATETIISSEANGKILQFNINEGDQVKAGQVMGYIDSTQLHLTRLQLMQSQKAVLTGRPDIKSQTEAFETELENAKSDKQRVENLVKGEMASQKQLDDANTRIAVIQSKITALKSQLGTSSSALDEQGRTIGVQLAQLEDQLRKCRIVNPVDGSILTKYAETFEMTMIGKPLYKVADLSSIILRCYITGEQLSKIKTGQKVKVTTTKEKENTKVYEGTIEWISDKAEFTPKTIQTTDERANLVYAIKIRVKNDGYLKIGMYGDIKFE